MSHKVSKIQQKKIKAHCELLIEGSCSSSSLTKWSISSSNMDFSLFQPEFPGEYKSELLSFNSYHPYGDGVIDISPFVVSSTTDCLDA